MITETKFQIGKNGITEGAIAGLNNTLKTHKRIRIAVLKSSGRDRNSIQEMAKSIQEKIDVHCEYRIIGFTIILRRQAKPKPTINKVKDRKKFSYKKK